MGYKYSIQVPENAAKAVGIALPISHKDSIMVAKAVRGLKLASAKRFLEDVIGLKRAVPMTRFNGDRGHKPGMAAGRYPVKVCKNVLKLLESAEANAQFKGLSTGNLVVSHLSAQKGPGAMRYGRRRREAKRTHVEVVLEERKK